MFKDDFDMTLKGICEGENPQPLIQALCEKALIVPREEVDNLLFALNRYVNEKGDHGRTPEGNLINTILKALAWTMGHGSANWIEA